MAVKSEIIFLRKYSHFPDFATGDHENDGCCLLLAEVGERLIAICETELGWFSILCVFGKFPIASPCRGYKFRTF